MGTFGKENNDMTNLSKPYNDVIIAPAENGATSLRPYSVNAFARVRGVLKRVTAAIAAGEPFSSGNSVSTTVGDELKYLRDTTTQINTELSDLWFDSSRNYTRISLNTGTSSNPSTYTLTKDALVVLNLHLLSTWGADLYITTDSNTWHTYCSHNSKKGFFMTSKMKAGTKIGLAIESANTVLLSLDIFDLE